MDPAGPTNYRLLAGILTNYVGRSPDAADIAVDLGRTTGPALVAASAPGRPPSRTRAVTELVDLMAELGFEPEPVDGRRAHEIRLRHCPFQTLAEEHGDVICSVHLGLMQGALTAMRAPVTVDRLEPFIEPDLCVAHVVSTSSSNRES
jgi:predicted ArsR family transcriptional regulator